MFKKILFFLFIFIGISLSQGYDETIDSYTMTFVKMDPGYILYEGSEIDTLIGDKALTFAWVNGEPSTPSYSTPNSGTMTAMVIVNDPSIWSSGTAMVTRDIILETGMYEVSMFCEDVEGNKSRNSLPLYLDIRHPTARVIINFRVLK